MVDLGFAVSNFDWSPCVAKSVRPVWQLGFAVWTEDEHMKSITDKSL